jgi:hypothetical protein
MAWKEEVWRCHVDEKISRSEACEQVRKRFARLEENSW